MNPVAWRVVKTVSGSTANVSGMEPPVEKEALEELPFAFDSEPIEGWRGWKVVDYREHGGVLTPRLAALGMSGIWPPRKRLEAFCANDGYHDAPHRECECGVWALRTRARAEQAAYRYGGVGGPVAFGPVRLWGRVLECENGWRAQYAYPAKLYVVGPASETSAQLERTYGVEVVNIDEPLPGPTPGAKIVFNFSAVFRGFARSLAAMNVRESVREELRAVGLSAPEDFWDVLEAEPLPTLLAPVRNGRTQPLDIDEGYLWDSDLKTWLSAPMRGAMFRYRRAGHD